MPVPLQKPSPNSTVSAKTTRAKSVLFFHKTTLGDKLHRLARISPSHLVAVEILVDTLLRELPQHMGKSMVLFGLWVIGY